MTERARPSSLLPRTNATHASSPQSGPPRVESSNPDNGSLLVWAGQMKKPRSFRTTMSAENRYAATMCLAITLTACILLGYRETPLYSARIPPPHARPPKRHHHHHHHRRHRTREQQLQELHQLQQQQQQQQQSTTSVTSNSTAAPTVWDPMPCEIMIARTKTIKLLALDFDQTIVDVHTKGRWRHSSKILALHVRPSIRCLISHCLEEGIPVAVTTFSTQLELIQQVLQRSLRHYSKEKKKGHHLDSDSLTIPVFGGDDWIEGKTEGKQSQLLLAMQHFNDDPDKEADEEEHDKDNNSDHVITAESTLLVDDDPQNIVVAEQDGYQTILYPAENNAHHHHHRHHRSVQITTKKHHHHEGKEEEAEKESEVNR